MANAIDVFTDITSLVLHVITDNMSEGEAQRSDLDKLFLGKEINLSKMEIRKKVVNLNCLIVGGLTTCKGMSSR